MRHRLWNITQHTSIHIRRFASLLAVLSLVTTSRAEVAEKKDEKKADLSTFVRVTQDDAKQPLALETANTRYIPAGEKYKGVVIDLVGAVHVGESDYYDALNKQFEDYDVVLYELVAPKEHKIPKGGKSNSVVGMLQNLMKSGLGLEHQLAKIDYTKANFVHADLTPDEFAKSMKERGESFIDMYFKMIGSSMSGSGPSDAELLAALFSKDRDLAFKRIFAEALTSDGAGAVLDGPGGSTILTERNKAALKVLDAQIAVGKKRIAIFYGAAHMPDFERRLLADYQMKRDSATWVKAWDLKSKHK